MRQHGISERESISDNGVRARLDGKRRAIRSRLGVGKDTVVSLGLPSVMRT